MKKLHLVLFLVIGISLISSCEDKNREEFPELEFDDLPLRSQEFLNEYFPDSKITDISLDRPQKASDPYTVNPDAIEEYDLMLYVTLENDIYIVFSTSNGNWIYIQADKGIPSSATAILLPNIYQELTEKEPQAKIVMFLLYDWHSIGITLDNGHTYGQVPTFNSYITLAEVGVADEVIERKLDEFVKRNHLEIFSTTGQLFKVTESNRVVYRLHINNTLFLSFNEEGDCIHGEIDYFSGDRVKVDGAERILRAIVENELPETIGEAISSATYLENMRIVASYENGYYGFRFEKGDLLVNEEIGVVPSPVGGISKLISDYYETPYTLVHPQGMTVVGVDEFFYSLLFESGNDFIRVYMDMYGNWTLVDAYYHDGGKQRDVILSMSMVEALLPDEVIDYMHENYKDEEVYQLKFSRGVGYSVYVEKYFLQFTEDGRFRGHGEWSIIYPG